MLRWLRRLLLLAVAIAIAAIVYARCEAVTPRADVAAAVGAVSKERLAAAVQRLATPRPEYEREATAKTLAWLEETLRGFGCAPQREAFEAPTQAFAMVDNVYKLVHRDGLPHCNLWVEQKGSAEPATVLEVGAHYDTVPIAPGADDNGSGVAAVLEVARLLAASPPRRTVRLFFFAMEEEGLVGSAAHVRKLRERHESIAGAIVLDMVGYTNLQEGAQKTPLRVPLVFSPPTVGDFLVVAGNFRSGWIGNLYEACADAYVPAAKYYSVNRLAGWFADAARSDHSSYWAAGYDAILLTDTAEMRNANYHQKSDLPATVDLEFLTANTRALVATVLHWSGG
jgi:hypothetical protein